MGGLAQVFMGQPFDIVKVRMQNQSLENPTYKSPYHCARMIAEKEGLHAFYKGTVAPLVGIVGCITIQFGFNEAAKSTIRDYNAKIGRANPKRLTPLQYVLCGGLAGLGNSFVSAPVEQVRSLLQNQTPDSK